MTLRDQHRAYSQRHMHFQASHGVVAANSFFRALQSPFELFSNLPLVNAFVLTNTLANRMTDSAYFLLCESYVDNLAESHGIRDTTIIQAAKMAVSAYMWLHRDPTIPTVAADLVNIDRILNINCPSYRIYSRCITAFGNAVRSLTPAVGAHHPRRAQYHYLQLHYIPRELVGQEYRARLAEMCNFANDQDIPDMAAYDIQPLTEAAFLDAWRVLPIRLKLRYFEFCSRLDTRETFNRASTHIYGAVIAIGKGGSVTDDWVNRRTDQMKSLHSITMNSRHLTPEIITRIFNDFVRRANLEVEDLYNYLRVWYYTADHARLESLSWMIEQTSMVGAAAVSLVAGTFVSWSLPAEAAIAAGISPNELTAFAEAVCWLEYSRLSSLIHPKVETNRYRNLLSVAQSITNDPASKNYRPGADMAPGAARAARMIAQFLRGYSTSKMSTALDPEVLARNHYNTHVLEANGVWEARPLEAAEGDNDNIIRGASAMDVVSRLPPTPRDLAFDALCRLALAAGAQTQWTIMDRGGPVNSPYRPLQPHIIQAAHVLGYDWVDPGYVYQERLIPYTGYIQPAWDLGCYGRDPIANPEVGPRPDGGPGGDDNDDDDQPWRPYRPLDVYQTEQVLRRVRNIADLMPQAPRPRAPGAENNAEDDNDDDADDGAPPPGAGGVAANQPANAQQAPQVVVVPPNQQPAEVQQLPGPSSRVGIAALAAPDQPATGTSGAEPAPRPIPNPLSASVSGATLTSLGTIDEESTTTVHVSSDSGDSDESTSTQVTPRRSRVRSGQSQLT